MAVLSMVLALLVTLQLIGARVGGTALGIGVVVAVLPVPLYASAILFIDRYEPAPPKLEALAFLYGASVAALLAFLIKWPGPGSQRSLQMGDPRPCGARVVDAIPCSGSYRSAARLAVLTEDRLRRLSRRCWRRLSGTIRCPGENR